MGMPAEILPYCGGAPVPAELLGQWNFDPLVMGGLLLFYAGARRYGARAAPLAAAVALMAALFISPLCALTSALFSARVAHHLSLTAVVAPLIAMAFPRRAGSVLAWAVAHMVVFWVWHAPQPYALTLASPAAYWLMQASLLGSAVGLWMALRAAPMPTAIAGLLGTMVQMGLLGALLTFSVQPLYPWHLITTAPWGLTALQDQQLAGLLMWVPGAGLYLFAALQLASRWIQQREHLA